MSTLDPHEAHNEALSAIKEGLKSSFPIVGREHSLHLVDVFTPEMPHPEDLPGQKKVLLEGKSWVAPVQGQVELRDNATGKVILSQKMRLMSIPVMTKRFSFIYNGQEHQAANQWQLKPGVYARRQNNGELEARFNVVNRAAFKMKLDPQSQLFHMEYKKANLPAYPLLKAMGVTDDEMKASWGEEVWKANQTVKRQAGVLAQFYRTSTNGKAPPEDEVSLKEHLRQVMKESKVRPEVVKETMGHAVDHVDAHLMLRAGTKLLAVQNGAPEDDRDSLVFKTLRSTGDFLKDHLQQSSRTLAMKVQRQLNKGGLKDVREALRPGVFDEAVRKLFQSSLVNPAKQINPVDMVGTALQTTIMGPGGIKSDIQVTDAAKMINPSQFGMIDPLTTPEGSATGISLRLPIGVKRIGDQPHIPVYSLKEKKTVYVDPATMMRSKVVMADEVEYRDGVPHPLNAKVRALGHGNEPEVIAFHEADYVMKHPSQVYGTTVNLVPFLQNNSGGRVSMASRHIEQSISLKDRDKPLVRVLAPGDKNLTFEEMLGKQSAHVAPVAGTVSKITPDGVHIKDAKGKEHVVHLYNNHPLNDTKSVMHSTPLVKVGDQVAHGSVVADNNYTRDGLLSLGKNLKTAFMSYHGLNFEDGLVITESAAKKLTSNHLHKYSLPIPDLDKGLSFDVAKFKNAHPLAYTKEQYGHIGEDGVAKVGSKIRPGDPLVIALQPYQIKDRTGIGAIRKSLASQLVDKSMRWESDLPGEVVAVHRNEQGVHVHVRTEEPMRVGDKLCFDEETEVLTYSGWKPVAQVTLSDQVCCLQGDGSFAYQRPTALHSYPQGGRMYRLESQQLDMFVTAQHRVYVQPRGEDAFKLLPAEQVLGKRVSHKKDGVWRGASPRVVQLPEHVAGTPGGRGYRILPPLSIPTRQFMFLLGTFLSEGSVYPDGLKISQVKPSGRKAFQEAAAKLGLSIGVFPEHFHVYGVQLRDYFKRFGHSGSKYIPSFVFDFEKEDLEVLFRWLMWGDGHTKSLPISYTTTSKRLADDVQRLCLHIGKAANVSWSDPPPLEKNGRVYPRKRTYVVRIINSKLTPQVNHSHAKKQTTQVEEIVENFTGAVHCVTVPGHVLYVRRNGKAYWSGNSHRHGGKGIVVAILPDKEAPQGKDGKPVDILFQPGGLGGRMNIGQVLEAMAGKIAEKTGKPYLVQNFDPKVKDWTRHMMGELKKHSLSDTEELFDPKTGLSYGHVMTGPLHFLKLVHQIDKKESMRSGMSLPKLPNHEKYDPTTLQPASGDGTGGQSWGQLGIYALLAHGAKGVLREGMTFKSEGEDPETHEGKRWRSQHNEVWGAIQTGQPLPTPKPTFSFHRFTELIKGAGVNVEKKGDEFLLSPLTNAHILKMSKGAVSDPTAVVHSKRDENGVFKPIKGGIFDEHITGGHGGTGWSHLHLPEPLPNPVFEEPIKKVLNITETVYRGILEGKEGVNPVTGKIGTFQKGFLTGGAAFKKLLGQVDVAKELELTKKELEKAKPSAVNNLYKRARFLQGLQKTGLKPAEAYVLDVLPIVPPKIRPLSNLEDGALHYEGINGIYNQLGQITNAMNSPAQKLLPESHKGQSRMALYDQVSALFGTAALPEGAKDKGILHMIAGTQPKRGIAQKGLLSRRQDMSARATIIPEPKLGLDEIGLPKEMALTIFRPQLVRQLVRQGSARDELAAQTLLSEAHKGKEDPSIHSALQNLAQDQLVFAKRDPALWKYSVQAFRPKIVPGKAIRIHPLVTGGFNADFDGDSALGFIRVEVSEDSRDKEGMPHDGSLPVFGLINLRDFPRAEILQEKENATIYRVPEGVLVPAYREGWGIQRMPVTEYSVHHRCRLWQVDTRRGRFLQVSEDHSLATLDPETLMLVKTRPAEAEGKVVAAMRRLPDQAGDAIHSLDMRGYARSTRGFQMDHLPLTEEVGWFIGTLVGDGWVSDTSARGNQAAMQVSISFGREGIPVAERWREVLEGIEPGVAFRRYEFDHEFEGSPAFSFRDTATHSILGRALVDMIGKGARNKHLPDSFLQWPEPARRGLLEGLLDTDGSLAWVQAKSKNAPQFQAAFHTTSSRLAREVVVLCESLGIVASVCEYARRGESAYNVMLSTSTMQEAEWLTLAYPKKQEALDRLRGGERVAPGRADWVPMPPSVRDVLLGHLRGLGASKKVKGAEEKRAFSLYVVLQRKEEVITRETFALLAELLGERMYEGPLVKWTSLCTDPSLSWDVVESAMDTGEVVEMYDLTVPDSWTFVMDNGLVVWDTMSIQVPVTEEAKRDAARMMPSKNVFSETTGGVAYLPSMESLLGLHRLSLVGKATNHAFTSDKGVIEALSAGKVGLNDQVKMGQHITTPGRVLLSSAVPEAMKHSVLTDLKMELNKKGVNALFTEVGKHHSPQFAATADKLKDLGYDTSTGIINTALHSKGKVSVGAHSFKMTDFLADTSTREPILQKADQEVEALRKKGLSASELKRLTAEVYLRADSEMQKAHKALGMMEHNALGKMTRAGMKPSADQYKQMVIAPMVMANSKGELIPLPVRRSYGEGVNQTEYTVQQEGARSGTVKKVQEVQEPGYMTKLLQNTSMDKLIDQHDCGTQKGLLTHVGAYDIVDRHLAAPLKMPGLDLPGGTLLTKDIVDKIRRADPGAKLSVRSPLHCHSEKGVCQKCYGLDANGRHLDIGANVGVLSAHALGERAVQLTLKAFHCLHEHSLVLVRRDGRILHTTLRSVFEEAKGAGDIREPDDLEVWGREGWVRVLGVSRHIQEPGTQMVFTRTRSGFGLLGQDNHPHMFAENNAVCDLCGTYPKRSNNGKQHHCRKCGRSWQGDVPAPSDFQMVMPSDMSDKSHAALVNRGPLPTPVDPPLASGWLAGIYCAEGYVRAQHKGGKPYVVGFGISQNSGTPIYEKIGAQLAAEFPGGRFGARPRAYQVYGREKGLWFERTFGRYSRNKGLPAGWSGMPSAWLADFVAGVFDGDGTLISTKDSSWKVGRIDTTSYLLAQQLHHILRSQGVHSRVMLSPWRKRSLHQGFAVTFPVTVTAKKMLSTSLKMQGVSPRPEGNDERFGEVVDYVRPVRFEGAPPWVYDLETETGTLFVNSVWTHNSGGVASSGGGALGSFGRLEQLTYLPDHLPNSAVHATTHGKVEKIDHTPTGVNVWVGGKAHFVGKDPKGNSLAVKQEGVFHTKPWTAPHVGMEVKPGDFLSDPNRTLLNPHRYFEATKSIDKVQERMAEEMHGLYADEGVRKRAVEVVVRSMGNLTQIEHPGGSQDLLRGQTYARSAIEAMNKKLKEEGKPLIRHNPILRGVNLLPLDMTTDWMARLNHQKLRGTVMQGAAEGWASDIHGRHPVPGLMYGAEFGRQSTDPRKAGKKTFY